MRVIDFKAEVKRFSSMQVMVREKANEIVFGGLNELYYADYRIILRDVKIKASILRALNFTKG